MRLKSRRQRLGGGFPQRVDQASLLHPDDRAVDDETEANLRVVRFVRVTSPQFHQPIGEHGDRDLTAPTAV